MSDETNESPAKIFQFRPATEFRVEKRGKGNCRCSYVGEKYSSAESPSVWVDEKTRMVECKKCGAFMEAFDYLWMLAIEGDSLHRDLRHMREEKLALKAQVSLLNDQIRDLKAEGRKLAKAPKPPSAEPAIDFRLEQSGAANQ